MRRLSYIVLLALCCSCGILKPKYITQIQHDTLKVYENNNVYLHDSVYVYKDRFIYTKGDTVYNTTIEYRDRYKIKEVHDTTYKEKAVYVDKEVPVEVEKPLSKIQKVLLTFGKLFVVVLIAALGYLGFKLYKKFRVV